MKHNDDSDMLGVWRILEGTLRFDTIAETNVNSSLGKATMLYKDLSGVLAQDQYDKTKLEERLARLTSGIGVITVGATTEAERKELRDRVDDAFCASKAAIRGGIVPGGGVALLNTMQKLKSIYEKGSDDYNSLIGDEIIGVKILCDSLDAPIRKILDNAGIDSSLIVSKIVENTDQNGYGYNVLSREFTNMIEAGIIDPTEVVTNEINNAASVASLLLTTDALIVDEPETKPTV